MYPSRTIDIAELYELVRRSPSLWQTYQLDVDAYNEAKRRLDYITPAGVFSQRSSAGLQKLSGFFQIDIDAKHIEQAGLRVDTLFLRLKSCEYVRFMAYSASGRGLWLLVEYDSELMKNLSIRESIKSVQNKYALIVESFIRNVLEKQYSITADATSATLAQARVIAYSYDVYLNEQSKAFADILEETPTLSVHHKKTSYAKSLEHETTLDANADYSALLELCEIAEQRSIDVFATAGTGYHDWLRSALAIASVYGERGRYLFERLSALRSCDTQAACAETVRAKYDDALRNGRSEVSISTVFWLFKRALGESVFYDVIHRHSKDKAAKSVIAEHKEQSDDIQNAIAQLHYSFDSVDEKTLALCTLVIEHLRKNNIVYCIDDTFFYKKSSGDGGKYVVLTGTDGGGGEFVDTLAYKFMQEHKIKIKTELYKKYVRNVLLQLVEHLCSLRFHEICAHNANFDVSRLHEYKCGYTVERFVDCLNVEYSRLYKRSDIINLWTEFFAGIGNVLFKPSRLDYWSGADRVPVLVGEVGAGKTTFVRALITQLQNTILPNAPSSLFAQLDDFDMQRRDVAVAMRDNILLLLDDVKERTLNSAEARELVTSTNIRVRALYKSSTQTFVRRAHFIATTNHEQLIREVQNNRRFFPIVLRSPAFNFTADFNAIELIIDAMQRAERCGFGDLKRRMDAITQITSLSFSADGDVVKEIAATYFAVDFDTLLRKSKYDAEYTRLLDRVKLKTIRELKNELNLDKKTVAAALLELKINIIDTTANGRRFYGFAIIHADELEKLTRQEFYGKDRNDFADVFKQIQLPSASAGDDDEAATDEFKTFESSASVDDDEPPF